MNLKNKAIFTILILLNSSHLFSMQYNNIFINNNIISIEQLPNELLVEILEYVIYKDIDLTKNDNEILNQFKNINNNIKNITLINNKFNILTHESINYLKSNFLNKLNKLNKKQKKKLLFILIKQKSLNKFTKIIIDKIILDTNQKLDKIVFEFNYYYSLNNNILIENKISLDINQYVLYLSTLHDNVEIVKHLKENKANINIKDSFKFTWAGTSNNLDIFKYLIENGANINTQNYFGVIPLILASKQGNLDIVKYLLENNANINIKDYLGRTALMHAVIENNFDITKLLIENGADINIQDNNGDTALKIAKKLKRANIAKILDNHLKNLNNRSSYCSII